MEKTEIIRPKESLTINELLNRLEEFILELCADPDDFERLMVEITKVLKETYK